MKFVFNRYYVSPRTRQRNDIIITKIMYEIFSFYYYRPFFGSKKILVKKHNIKQYRTRCQWLRRRFIFLFSSMISLNIIYKYEMLTVKWIRRSICLIWKYNTYRLYYSRDQNDVSYFFPRHFELSLNILLSLETHIFSWHFNIQYII